MSLVISLLIFAAPTINASQYYVYLGGESIGLQVESDVKVTGKYYVETNFGETAPWKNSDINVGDCIIEIEDQLVHSLDEIQKIMLNNSEKKCLSVKLKRNGININTMISPAITKDNKLSLGLYIKDHIIGVGTLTFIYNNHFASLAHAISDSKIVENEEIGVITYSKVLGIRKPVDGNVGEKKAALIEGTIGTVYKNCPYGVFGTIEKYSNSKKIEISEIKDVTKGSAQLYTVVNGNTVECFNIEIIETKDQKEPNIKGIRFKVTDKKLIETSGGIVQGMSGSPIVQNGKLIGAVSHVNSDNPKLGYGIYAKWMFEELM